STPVRPLPRRRGRSPRANASSTWTRCTSCPDTLTPGEPKQGRGTLWRPPWRTIIRLIMGDLLKRALNAPVSDVLPSPTPLDPAPNLSARLRVSVLLKREDLTPIFSFKIRGAYNKIAQLSAAERAAGVIAASAGNHAQGVAYAAAKLGLRSRIVMPR